MRALWRPRFRAGPSPIGPVAGGSDRLFAAVSVLCILAVLGLILFFHVRQAREFRSAQGRIEQLEKDIARLDARVAGVAGFKEANRRLERMYHSLQHIQATRSVDAAVIPLIAREMPDGLWIETYLSRKRVARLLGCGRSEQEVRDLVEGLGREHLFSKVEMLYVWPKDKNGLRLVSFGIEVTLADSAARPTEEDEEDRGGATGWRDVFRVPRWAGGRCEERPPS